MVSNNELLQTSWMLLILSELKDGNIRYRHCGICGNVSTASAKSKIITDSELHQFQRWARIWLTYQFTKWPKYSGNHLRPIKEPSGRTYGDGDMWVGEYGALRYELLDFLIEQAGNAVTEYTNQINKAIEERQS